MDNSVERRPEVRYCPDGRYTLLAGAGLLAALAVAILAGDLPGRLLAVVAAVLLGAYLGGDLVFRPRLVVSSAGLVVNSPLVRARLAWPEIEDVRADVRQRMGLKSTTLEIDAGPVLAVLSRRAIGADPEAAAELIRAFRPPLGS